MVTIAMEAQQQVKNFLSIFLSFRPAPDSHTIGTLDTLRNSTLNCAGPQQQTTAYDLVSSRAAMSIWSCAPPCTCPFPAFLFGLQCMLPAVSRSLRRHPPRFLKMSLLLPPRGSAASVCLSVCHAHHRSHPNGTNCHSVGMHNYRSTCAFRQVFFRGLHGLARCHLQRWSRVLTGN